MRERLGHVRKTETGTVELPTVGDTMAFGERLGRQLRAGDVVVLSGPLGAGKTALTKGIALGMDVEGPVTSPTFVLAGCTGRAAPGGPRWCMSTSTGCSTAPAPNCSASWTRFDLDTDLEDAVVVVEWGEGLAERLSDNHLDISLQRCVDTDVRIAHWQWSRA